MTVILSVLLVGNMSVQAAGVVSNGTMGQVTSDASLPAPPDTFSETAVLMDADTGKVLSFMEKGKMTFVIRPVSQS